MKQNGSADGVVILFNRGNPNTPPPPSATDGNVQGKNVLENDARASANNLEIESLTAGNCVIEVRKRPFFDEIVK